MNLNYLAFFLIAFVPLIVGYFWFQPNNRLSRWAGIEVIAPSKLPFIQIIILLLLSFGLVYGYINLVIHQLGFYELFFTDIMFGNEEAKKVVEEFLAIYGEKHRHFGHGVLHGAINAFIFALPFTWIHAILQQKHWKHMLYYFLYWLVTSMLIGGLIAEFV